MMMIAACLSAFLAQASPWEPLKLPEEAAGKTLRSVASIDGRSGWMVGDKGLCLQTQDGGRTWKLRGLGTQATLRSIRFMNEKVGFVVGDGDSEAPKPTGHVVMGRQMTSGTVLWTLDGGETWRKSHPPTNFEIHCAESRGGPVQFGISGGEAHLDGDILRSPTDVSAWNGTDFRSSRCYRALFDIRSVEGKQWVSVGSAVSVGFVPPPTDPLYLDAKCRALYSRDGGDTWAPSKGSEGQGCLRGLAVGPPGLRILGVGDAGTLLSSEDKGASWKSLNSGCGQDLFAVAWSLTDPRVAVAVGDLQTALLSPDGGQSWKRTSSGTSGALLAVAPLGDGFIAAGEAGLARRASAKGLREAKAVEPPVPAAKPVAKGPTKVQLERARVGASSVYEVVLNVPAMKMNNTFQKEEKITALSPTGYTVEVQVVQGTPPPGQPAKGSVEIVFETLLDYSSWKVGEAREESNKGDRLSRTRLADEMVKVGEKTWDCIVIQVKGQSSDGGTTVENKSWFAKSTEIPGMGFVKDEVTQEVTAPQGKIKLSQTTRLVSFRRGND
jgi:photosystem II stability/assembly factor-like uncharacterized protein